MCNIKKRDFYNAITGDIVGAENYGVDAAIFKKVDNVVMIFDSRGCYLGINTCKGKIINGKYITKKGPSDFKSFSDLKIWAGEECSPSQFIETGNGTFLQIESDKGRTYQEK
jgi:hypothetical protein